MQVMNAAYTSLSWFLCSTNPTPKQVKVAKTHCSEYALELQGCHTRALDDSGFAAVPPAKPKSLTGTRARLSTSFVDTELEGVQVRRSDGELKNRLSQVLFRVVDLRRAFSGWQYNCISFALRKSDPCSWVTFASAIWCPAWVTYRGSLVGHLG